NPWPGGRPFHFHRRTCYGCPVPGLPGPTPDGRERPGGAHPRFDRRRFPMSADDPPLPVVTLADIVRLRDPYQPVRGQDRQRGPFGFGIVAELLTVRPDGRVLRASLYLYDPARKELFMGPNGIPEFVDCHGSDRLSHKGQVGRTTPGCEHG